MMRSNNHQAPLLRSSTNALPYHFEALPDNFEANDEQLNHESFGAYDEKISKLCKNLVINMG
jgi:hypothetical protein